MTGNVQKTSVIQILLIIVSVLLLVGIITCILSHYKMGARSWNDQRNRPQPVTRMQLQSPCPHEQQHYSYSVAAAGSSIMYSPTTVQERQQLEAGAFQDHLVQLQSVQTDLILDLPHSVHLPDGEEQHHHNSKHLKIRDREQQGEITRSFIRPPPNRTVHEVDSFLPFRSNSVSLLQKPSHLSLPQAADCAPLVMRSHSMSSGSKHHQRCPVSKSLWTPALVSTHRSSTNSSDVSAASSNNLSRTCNTNSVTERDKSCSVDNNAVTNRYDRNFTDKQNSSV